MATLALGAPGIYFAPLRAAPALGGVRLDVAAFFGVAPRGPAREPDLAPDPLPEGPTLHLPRRRTVAVPVESFAEYRRLFGGFEGPGRLPFAVASFFEQGGRRAYVARLVHDYGDPLQDAGGVAFGRLGGVRIAGSGEAPLLVARSEGSWGNGLRAALGLSAAPLGLAAMPPATAGRLPLPGRSAPPLGSLLRCRLAGGVSTFAFVAAIDERQGATALVLDRILASPPLAAEVLLGKLRVEDGRGLAEEHAEIGLSARHPRWLASVLCHQSNLLFPHADWVDGELEPLSLLELGAPLLPPLLPPQFAGPAGEPVADRYGDLEPEDFFDPGFTFGDEKPGDGVLAAIGLGEVAMVLAPDLYSPFPLAPPEIVLDPASLAGPEFAPCDDFAPAPASQDNPPPPLAGLELDPRLPADFERIVALQQRLAAIAERSGAFVALLDVPPGLSERRILDWRSRFDSSYAAAYHPWLRVARPDDGRDVLIPLPPSAAAAGIVARQELAFGVPHGPFNMLAEAAVALAEPIAGDRHDRLHQQAVNVFQRERDGIRLSAGRTLSSDPSLRQLSVRRLLMLLARSLEREMQWVVFEPNGPALWREIRHFAGAFLRRLFVAGAFRGAREEEAFFVRCGEEENPQRGLDAGRLVALIGVAPAEPLEFLVLRLTRGGDGSLTVEA